MIPGTFNYSEHMNEQLRNELDSLITELQRPLPPEEMVCGWTPEAQAATVTFLNKLRDAAIDHQPLPNVSGGVRALDAWGVFDGRLMVSVCAFYNHVRQSSG